MRGKKGTGRFSVDAVVARVAADPGCCKNHAADYNTRYGYRAVARAEAAGLIRIEWPSHISACYVVEVQR